MESDSLIEPLVPDGRRAEGSREDHPDLLHQISMQLQVLGLRGD